MRVEIKLSGLGGSGVVVKALSSFLVKEYPELPEDAPKECTHLVFPEGDIIGPHIL